MEALMILAGVVIGGLLGLLLAAGLTGFTWWLEGWRERNCAQVTWADTDLGSGDWHTTSRCRSCLRLVGERHKRSCELA